MFQASTKLMRFPLTDSEMFSVPSSSAFFSREKTHSLRFCLQRDAAARFLSRKRCLRSSGSSSTVRRRRPPVGWAGDTWRPRWKRRELKNEKRKSVSHPFCSSDNTYSRCFQELEPHFMSMRFHVIKIKTGAFPASEK